MPESEKVHLYTLCWNDSKMLPHFFNHYSPIVDRFFVFDNGSTDGSLEMLAGDERVQVSHFRTDFDSFAETELRLSEEVWKSSRGLAEWVLVLDIDEHLYHEDLSAYLRACRERDVTAIQAIGYEMISDTFPDAGARLCDVVRSGVRCPSLHDKLCLFDPCAITRSNFTHGRHTASPEGRVNWPSAPEVLLLHYKKLGLEYEIARSAELRTGLRSTDIEKNWGYQYLRSAEEIAAKFKRTAARAKPVPRRSGEIWGEEITRLRDSNGTLEKENGRLSVRVADSEATITSLQTRLAAADLEAARLRNDLAARELRCRELEAQATALSGDVQAAARRASDTEQRLHHDWEQLMATQDELRAMQEELTQTKQALSKAVAELKAVHRSGSWRMTRPFRSLHRRLARHPVGPSHAPAKETTSPVPIPVRSEEHEQVSATLSTVAPAHTPRGAAGTPPDVPPGSVTTSAMTAQAAPLHLRKQQIERDMCSEPTNWTLRHEYFELLESISYSHLGCLYASLPEIATPLMVRAATSDIWNLRQIFLDNHHDEGPYIYGDYAFAIPPLTTILDLGAYCGYVAVYFANRFPEAEIMCVEPPGANFDALIVNTAAYSNIRCLAAAVWPERTALQWSGPVLGDWGNQFAPGDRADDNTIPAYTIPDILAMRGWDRVDFVKCVTEGVQVDLLAHRDRQWAERVLLVTTKPPKGVWPNADDEERLLAAFPDDVFERITNENMILGFRRRSEPDSPQPHLAPAMPLVPTSPRLRPIVPANVNDRFGFYRYGSAGLNLAVNQSGMPPASLTWRADLAGHHSFAANVVSGASPLPSAEVMVTLSVRDRVSGAVPVDERLAVQAAAEVRWNVTFGPLSGGHEVTIAVEPAAPYAFDEQIPWIRIVEPRFL